MSKLMHRIKVGTALAICATAGFFYVHGVVTYEAPKRTTQGVLYTESLAGLEAEVAERWEKLLIGNFYPYEGMQKTATYCGSDELLGASSTAKDGLCSTVKQFHEEETAVEAAYFKAQEISKGWENAIWGIFGFIVAAHLVAGAYIGASLWRNRGNAATDVHQDLHTANGQA